MVAGLTYKKNVADLRNSLSISVFHTLKKNIKQLKSFDPYVSRVFKKKYSLIDDKDFKNFDIYIILTNHDIIKKKLKNLKNKIIIDIFS